MSEIEQILSFWRNAGPSRWFSRNDAFDAEFERRFHALHWRAARRELEAWMETPNGALALLILLDQFPRNCFRGSAHAYATDGLALHYAGRIIDAGLDAAIESQLRMFAYLPYEHSERLEDQDRSVALFAALGQADYLRYAQLHRDTIRRFGRFPHRNAALGRISSTEELAYLAQGGGFGA